MRRRFFLLAICCMLPWGVGINPSSSRETAEGPDGVVWTAIIPDAFPRYLYTWRMSGDGAYREDGRDVSTGVAIQATHSGRWSIDGPRMILRQQDLPYVFDGVVMGGLYNGTLYWNGHAVSRFCAAKGDLAPESSGAKPGVALLGEAA
jgi:hypothetical protein